MSTLAELKSEGVEQARLPFWNEYAYLVIGPGIWHTLYDVTAGLASGEPIPVGDWDCQRNDWEPVAPTPEPRGE